MLEHEISVEINGRRHAARVEARTTLADFIHDDSALTGTHLGCEHGVCGACTVLVNGLAVRSCLMFAVQVDGASVTTVEGMSEGQELGPVQHAFWDEHGLQCGFCTPGLVMSVHAMLQDNPAPSPAQIREGLSGNICRCTGYQGIVRAVERAAASLTGRDAPDGAT